MATMFLQVRDGKFVSVKGEYDEMTAKAARGNGWECTFDDKGVIHCVAKREYDDGEWQMSYMVRPDGFARLSLRRPDEKMPKNIKRGFVTEKRGKLEGVIALVDAPHIANYHAYFRTKAFQDFLDKRGIHVVKHENPNQKYFGKPECLRVYTDGLMELPSIFNMNRETGEIMREVKNATWVIVSKTKIVNGVESEFNTLYTLMNPMEIKFPSVII